MGMCWLPGHPARFWVKKKHSWAKAIPLFCSGTIWPGWTVHSRAADEVRSVFQPAPPHLPVRALIGTYLSCYGHSVEDIPQHNPYHHFVPEVEDDTFAIVIPLCWGLGNCRIAGKKGDFWGFRLCLTLGPDTSPCGQPPKQSQRKQSYYEFGKFRRKVSLDTCFKLLLDDLFSYASSVNAGLLQLLSTD